MDDITLSASPIADFERLFADEEDYLAGMTTAERRAVLASHSWSEYLETYAGIGAEVLTFVQRMPHGVWAIGADALPAWMAADQGYAGFAGMDLGYDDGDEEEYEGFYFPDGNASIARLLVRKTSGVLQEPKMLLLMPTSWDFQIVSPVFLSSA